jgi:AcrR family transcriptional regulator
MAEAGTTAGTGRVTRGARAGAAGTDVTRPARAAARAGTGSSGAGRTGAKPNRRGVRSRELVLDAAERVMAEHGYEAATVARVVEAAGIPLSSVYHYFGSKEGILLAVMERGAERFFTDLPRRDRRAGRPAEHLAAVLAGDVRALERHPHFLRLLIVLAVQPPAVDGAEVQAVIGRIRDQARQLLRAQIGLAFGDDPDSPATDQLARFVLAAIDGAFLACQADPGVTLGQLLQPLPAGLPAARRALLATAG